MTLLTESVFGLLLLNRILVEFIVVVNQSIYLAYAKRNNCGKMELIEIDAGLLCIAVAAHHTHTHKHYDSNSLKCAQGVYSAYMHRIDDAFNHSTRSLTHRPRLVLNIYPSIRLSILHRTQTIELFMSAIVLAALG